MRTCRSLLVFVLVACCCGKADAAEDTGTVSSPDHFIPVEKNLSLEWIRQLTTRGDRRVLRGKQLLTIGMPCGGICAGQLYVRGDGTLAQWWIANQLYNTGVWWFPMEDRRADFPIHTPQGPFLRAYRTYRPASYVDQGFALRVRTAKGEAQVVTLDQDDFDDIGFCGEYPIATIDYGRKAKSALPVTIQAEVFSPFIPLNARDSAIPATVLHFTIQNTLDEPVDVSLAGWLQNAVCQELAGGNLAMSRNVVVRHGDLCSVQMDLSPSPRQSGNAPRLTIFEDFEHGYNKWTIEGTAFGQQPAVEAPVARTLPGGWQGRHLADSRLGGDKRSQGRAVSKTFTIADPYITFVLGGDCPAQQARLDLVVDDKVVRTATGTCSVNPNSGGWLVKDLIGREAHMEMVDQDPDGYIMVDHICFTDSLPDAILPREVAQFGEMSLTALAPAATATACWASKSEMLAELGRTSRIQGPAVAETPLGEKCVAAICTPLHLLPGETRKTAFVISWYFPDRHGHMPNCRPNCGEVIGNMYANWFSSSLDVARHVADNFDRLITQTHRFRDAYFNTTLPYWFAQRIAMPISTFATETCQWRRNGRFYGFEGVGCCAGTCSHVWHYEQATASLFPSLQRSMLEMQTFHPKVGFVADSGMIRFRGEANQHWAADGQTGNILMAYRQHQCSPDDRFLRANWLAIRKAIEFLIEQDGNADGLIEGEQPNTYDIAFYGANTLTGSMYLATLRAGEEMARVMGDDAFADQCRRIFLSGSRLSVERLFNGEYFIQEVDLKKHPDWQFGDGCLADQMIGQTWAHYLGLGYLYPKEKVRSVLQSVWKYNWAPDVGPQIGHHRPEIIYADPGEAGLFLCTWPKSPHMGDKSVRYRDTIWAGIEYQVAAGMIYEGLITEGLAIVRAIDERYDPAKHNPWNSLLCGDHYARDMASWGCLLAATGYTCDCPAGKLGFAPRLSTDKSRFFFSAAEGWGNSQQDRRVGTQTNCIELVWGRLRLNELQLELPAGATLRETAATVAGRAVACEAQSRDHRVTIRFPQPLKLQSRQSLDVTMKMDHD